jgi:endonuclease/exonuclease/phosphatase family metal-dependent hydrolase
MHHGQVSKQIAKGLLVLRERIDASRVPSSKLDESVNIATWNVRDFGKTPRSEAAIHYIAEIMGQFDLIGLVELRDNLSDLRRVLDILGPYWRVVYSDMIPDRGGNRERVAYVYDKRAVTFNGLAAEANEPREKKGTEYLSKASWWRSPYIASFRSGNFDFMAITTHVRWGSSEASRKTELQLLANWVDGKAKEPHAEDRDILVMGDLNIPSRKSALFRAITSKGLKIPKGLAKEDLGTNLARNKRYDQILHLPRYSETFADRGGVLDFYADDYKALFPRMKSKHAFTFQISDHLPLWIQVKTDIDGMRLEQIIRG